MTTKPWREIAKPHKDVLEGSFQQSEFAADLTEVISGTASEEYRDAEKFFARTFITEGMQLLLTSVAKRLAGRGGDPVIQLQTAFGGGKTHTMLAVYHLAGRKTKLNKLTGIPSILKEVGIKDLPQANVAVLDGNNLSPSQPLRHGEITVNTLWGELAWQLLGKAGYDKVAAADRDGTSPGKDALKELLGEAAPCVVLMDELVAFIRQFGAGEQYQAGTFDTNMSFIQALTEAMKAEPRAILLASLPESDLEVGGDVGQRALATLEKFFGRVESVWKPVALEEAFEIVRRRLFEKVGDKKQMDSVCKSFMDLYTSSPDLFPPDTQTTKYQNRIRGSYPIHPEIFDRLYEDWSTLDKFQKTRGVLQYMAIVIHRLWNSENSDALIMPGSIPLDDVETKNKSIHYLPQGWEPVIDSEIDGPRSTPSDIDGLDLRFGGVQAARRAARTIFLGSAPSTSGQTIRGIAMDRILLGTVQPQQSVAVFQDVLGRLRDTLHHLYSENDRYWFDVTPNLRREMESRKQKIEDAEELLPLVKKEVSRVLGSKHFFAGVHVFTPSSDVPDEYGTGPRLVVLPPSAAYSPAADNLAFQAANEILRQRGDQPRQKQNRLIFLSGDQDVISRLLDQSRTLLAWMSIFEDFKADRMVYQSNQMAEVKRAIDGVGKTVGQLVRDAYKWLLSPIEEFVDKKPSFKWEVVAVSPSAPNLIQEIEHKLYEEEWLISNWSPIHLRNLLSDWYFKDSQNEVNPQKLYQDTCRYLYLPRLASDRVLKDAISSGLESEDFFGFARGKEGEKYLGFAFGQTTLVTMDDSELLIERDTAKEYAARLEKDRQVETISTETEVKSDQTSGKQDVGPDAPKDGGTSTTDKSPLKLFFGTIQLDDVQAKMQFAQIVDEVIEQFTSRPDTKVKISVDIQARSKKGFDETTQRSVRENCNVLRFTNSEFEEGE